MGPIGPPPAPSDGSASSVETVRAEVAGSDGSGPDGSGSGAEHPAEPHAGDNSTLRRLRAELGNDAAADHFVTDFLDLLDDRLTSLRSLIERRRVEDSVTALLTIETSSLMIGADDLAGAATRMRLAVSEQRHESLDPLLAELGAAAEQTKLELSPKP